MVRIDWSRYSPDIEGICLWRNQITEMNWEGAPSGLKEIRLTLNQITEINWEGAPSGLQRIYLFYNQITEMNWEGVPSGLKEIDLNHNPITEMNWEGVPEGIDMGSHYLNGLKNEYKKSMKCIKSKTKPLRPITDQIKHLSLTNPENSKYNVIRKYCGVEFRELTEEAVGFDLVH